MSEESKAKVTYVAASGLELIVRIEVPSYEALVGYRPLLGETTFVTATPSCSEEDLRAIRTHCDGLSFMTFEAAPATTPSVDPNNVANGGGPSGTLPSNGH